MIKNISNLGDAALYCDFGTEVNKEVNNKVIRYFKSIQKENIDGINNLTPSYNKLIISFDLRKKNFQTINLCFSDGLHPIYVNTLCQCFKFSLSFICLVL